MYLSFCCICKLSRLSIYVSLSVPNCIMLQWELIITISESYYNNWISYDARCQYCYEYLFTRSLTNCCKSSLNCCCYNVRVLHVDFEYFFFNTTITTYTVTLLDLSFIHSFIHSPNLPFFHSFIIFIPLHLLVVCLLSVESVFGVQTVFQVATSRG